MNWAYDGQRVTFMYKERRVPGTVTQAMGDTARVENPLLKIAVWLDVQDLEECTDDREKSVAGKQGVLHLVES